MRPDQRDAGYLLDMLEHARGVARTVEGRTLDDGEAARRVSEAFQNAHPEIPWAKIVAQRHVLAHEYGEIQDDIVWKVATVSVPELISRLEPLIPPLPPQPEC
jgi:hypothetical protein